MSPGQRGLFFMSLWIRPHLISCEQCILGVNSLMTPPEMWKPQESLELHCKLTFSDALSLHGNSPRVQCVWSLCKCDHCHHPDHFMSCCDPPPLIRTLNVVVGALTSPFVQDTGPTLLMICVRTGCCYIQWSCDPTAANQICSSRFTGCDSDCQLPQGPHPGSSALSRIGQVFQDTE